MVQFGTSGSGTHAYVFEKAENEIKLIYCYY